MARNYAATGVTALVVAADATVRHIQTDVTSGTRLEQYLQQLRFPVATLAGARVR
jgi:hypothetical protein